MNYTNKLDRYILMEVVPIWKNSTFVLDFIVSLSCLSLALIINHFAVSTATANAYQNPSIGDIVLDNIYLNTGYIDRNIALFLAIGAVVLTLFIPAKTNFFMRSISILILVRDFFINLTFLGLPPGATPTVSFFTKGGDLFFSGHTALPFLGILVFWEYVYVRNIFILITILMAVQVLVGHQHYTIDVFAAPFITYSVFEFSKKILSINLKEGKLKI